MPSAIFKSFVHHIFHRLAFLIFFFISLLFISLLHPYHHPLYSTLFPTLPSPCSYLLLSSLPSYQPYYALPIANFRFSSFFSLAFFSHSSLLNSLFPGIAMHVIIIIFFFFFKGLVARCHSFYLFLH